MKLKLSVTAKPPLDDERWYRIAQSAARVMMMVRNVSLSYTNRYSMSLPGFTPSVGDAFGQSRTTGVLSP